MFPSFQLLQRYLTDLINDAKENYDSPLSKPSMDCNVSPKEIGQYQSPC